MRAGEGLLSFRQAAAAYIPYRFVLYWYGGPEHSWCSPCFPCI